MKANIFRCIQRQKVLLPLFLIALMAGYIALGIWIEHAPDQATATLHDLSGDRAALDAFPLGLTLQSDLMKQDIQIENGIVFSSTRYSRNASEDKAEIPVLYEHTPLLSPTRDAKTSTTFGFLPSVYFTYEAPKGYIVSTNKAEIYLNVSVDPRTAKNHAGTLCFSSGMFLESTKPDISIGWYTEEQTAPSVPDSSESRTSRSCLYGAALGPNRFDEHESHTFYLPMQSVVCEDQVFFLPQTETVLDDASLQTLSLTGTRSLYRILETDRRVSPENHSTPDQIQTCGKAEAILSFPAENSTLLTLEAIDNRSVFLGMQVENELQFYLLDASGQIQDHAALPIPDGIDRSLIPTLDWECSDVFRSTDSDGTPCRTLAVSAFHESYDTTIMNETSESPSLVREMYGTEYLTFRITDRLTCVSRLSSGELVHPVIMAWRDGRMLVLDAQSFSLSFPTASPGGVNRPYLPSDTRIYLTVYEQTNPVYRGELLTDVNDQYFWVSYERQFRDFHLLDDPDTWRSW